MGTEHPEHRRPRTSEQSDEVRKTKYRLKGRSVLAGLEHSEQKQHRTVMMRGISMALASILAVLVLSGQALGHRAMLIAEDDIASAYDAFEDSFAQFRQKASSVLGVSLDQIGDVMYNFGSGSVVTAFTLLPESGSFKETVKSGDLGTLSDFTDDEDTPGAFDVAITVTDDEGAYDDFVLAAKQVSSALGIKQDQIGEMDITMQSKCTFVTLSLFPESDSFEASEVKRINDTLQSGGLSELGAPVDLSYDEDAPDALDASFLGGGDACDFESMDADSSAGDYISVLFDATKADDTSAGARKLLSEFDDYYYDDYYY